MPGEILGLSCVSTLAVLMSTRLALGIDEETDAVPDYGLPQFRRTLLEWHTQAACLCLPIGIFFPEIGHNARQAKVVCATCPVTAQCLADALASGIRYGVWGGLSARERRGLSLKIKREQERCNTESS